MDDIQLWSQSIDWVSIVVSVAVIVLPTLATIVVTALLGAQMVPAARKFVLSLRSFVDQPTDAAIVALAKELHVTPEWLSAKITELIDASGKEPVIVPTPAPTLPLLPPAPETRAPETLPSLTADPALVRVASVTFPTLETRAPDAPVEAVP